MSSRIPIIVPLVIDEKNHTGSNKKSIGGALIDLIAFPLKEREIKLILLVKQSIQGTGSFTLEDFFNGGDELAYVEFDNVNFSEFKTIVINNIKLPVVDENNLSCVEAKIKTSTGGKVFIKHASLRIL